MKFGSSKNRTHHATTTRLMAGSREGRALTLPLTSLPNASAVILTGLAVGRIGRRHHPGRCRGVATMSIARQLTAARRMLAEASAILARIEIDIDEQNSGEWVDTAIAAQVLGLPADTVRSLCRNKGYGRKKGGRWQADLEALRSYYDQTR